MSTSFTKGGDGCEFIGTKLFAKLAGETEARVRQWAARGEVTAYRFGRRRKLWFRRDDVISFLRREREK